MLSLTVSDPSSAPRLDGAFLHAMYQGSSPGAEVHAIRDACNNQRLTEVRRGLTSQLNCAPGRVDTEHPHTIIINLGCMLRTLITKVLYNLTNKILELLGISIEFI